MGIDKQGAVVDKNAAWQKFKKENMCTTHKLDATAELTDQQKDFAKRVQGFPTTVIIKNGAVIETLSGAMAFEPFVKAVKQRLE
jgi:hypothetical protein